MRAAHRTTEEFLHDLLKLPDSPLAEHRETLGDFLDALRSREVRALVAHRAADGSDARQRQRLRRRDRQAQSPRRNSPQPRLPQPAARSVTVNA